MRRQRYISKFKEFDYAEYNWIVIINDYSNDAITLGFKSDKIAEKAVNYYKNFSNAIIFQVDYYGKGSMQEIEDFVGNNYNLKFVQPNAKFKDLDYYIKFIDNR